MEMSIREAKARFTEAAARGKRVVVTKHGRPFMELVAVQKAGGMDFDRTAAIRQTLGLVGLTVGFSADSDDPAFSRQVLGLEE
jgi:antitoxin (DNA-binding transcriptional repressor) of toxin-antitoxin stability system